MVLRLNGASNYTVLRERQQAALGGGTSLESRAGIDQPDRSEPDPQQWAQRCTARMALTTTGPSQRQPATEKVLILPHLTVSEGVSLS